MLSTIFNPVRTKEIIKAVPRQFFFFELNIYILLLYLFLYYILVDPKDIHFANRPLDYKPTLLDYLYFTVIVHGTVGFGDIVLLSPIGKILKIAHSLTIIAFFVLFFS